MNIKLDSLWSDCASAFAFVFVPYKRTFSHVENCFSGTGPISQMSQEICNIPCKVCDAPSSGYHFGAITCEGCKVSKPAARNKRFKFALRFTCAQQWRIQDFSVDGANPKGGLPLYYSPKNFRKLHENWRKVFKFCQRINARLLMLNLHDFKYLSSGEIIFFHLAKLEVPKFLAKSDFKPIRSYPENNNNHSGLPNKN